MTITNWKTDYLHLLDTPLVWAAELFYETCLCPGILNPNCVLN